MQFDLDDTIAAIASTPGGAFRGIIRLSGLDVAKCLSSLLGAQFDHGKARRSAPITLRLAGDLGDVPARLYFWPDRRSYTRQPSAEVHLPGSPPLLQAALAKLCEGGARLAKPGEFTLRAFLAGRIDLTQAEAVLGVIEARGESQLEMALSQLAGGLNTPLLAVRECLLELLAHLEAGLDFADEDIEFITSVELAHRLTAASTQLADIADRMASRSHSDALPIVALVGAPNAGKSSLFNALAGVQAAIVADIAGTTRDYVSRRIEVHGWECVLVDTAGHDTANDNVTSAAQDATTTVSQQADVTIVCLDASNSGTGGLTSSAGRPDTELTVWTKCDLAPAGCTESVPRSVTTSSRTGTGIDRLRLELARRLRALPRHDVLAGTAERCRDSVRLAANALHLAAEAANKRQGDELVAFELRTALDELGRVVGVIYNDDVLDRIFGRFCIGK